MNDCRFSVRPDDHVMTGGMGTAGDDGRHFAGVVARAGGIGMSVAYFGEWPKLAERDSTEVSAAIAGKVQARLGGQPPAGAIFHAEGLSESGGWWVFDIWASDADRDAFQASILDPLLNEAGVGSPQIRRLDVAWDSTQMMGPG